MIVTVQYHVEADGVWAESSDVEGMSVAGADLAEVRQLVREGLEFYLDGEDVDLREALVGRDEPIVAWSFGDSTFIFPTGSFGKGSGVLAKSSIHMPAAHAYAQGSKTASVGTLVDT